MKKSVFSISNVFLILGLCWISVIGNSQDLKMNKKNKREVRKDEKMKEYEALGVVLESRNFVFTMDRVQSTTGANISNVIRFFGSRVSVNLEDPERPNNSGLFINGNIYQWELLKYPKSLNYSIRFDVNESESNSLSVYEIFMSIHADRAASVEIKNRTVPTGLYNGGSISYWNGKPATYVGHIKEY